MNGSSTQMAAVGVLIAAGLLIGSAGPAVTVALAQPGDQDSSNSDSGSGNDATDGGRDDHDTDVNDNDGDESSDVDDEPGWGRPSRDHNWGSGHDLPRLTLPGLTIGDLSVGPPETDSEASEHDGEGSAGGFGLPRAVRVLQNLPTTENDPRRPSRHFAGRDVEAEVAPADGEIAEDSGGTDTPESAEDPVDPDVPDTDVPETTEEPGSDDPTSAEAAPIELPEWIAALPRDDIDLPAWLRPLVPCHRDCDPGDVVVVANGGGGGGGAFGAGTAPGPATLPPGISAVAPPVAVLLSPVIVPDNARVSGAATPPSIAPIDTAESSAPGPAVVPPAMPAGPVVPVSFRVGYPEYLRTAETTELAGIALPGVAGMLGLTAIGGLIGFRQARAGQVIRSAGTARFMK